MKSFGGVRRGAAGLLAVVVAMAGLFVVGAAAPAAADDVYACTETIYPGQRPPDRPSYDGIDQVVDVSLSMGYFQYAGEGAEVFLTTSSAPYGPEFRVNTIGFGAQGGTYVFATSGGSPGPVNEPGTYGASQEVLDAFRPYGQFVAVFLRTNGREIPVDNWTMELTFFNCDSDGDGASDLRDNCPTVSNRPFLDFDTDGVGDACDADADGDNAVDTSDNCPMLANADQTDSDGDGRGNACDTSPFPPPPPPPPTPTSPPAPTPTSSATPGVPVITPPPAAGASARVVTLKYVKKKRVFRGVVSSAVGSCAVNAEVTLWRQARRADRRLVVNTTNEAGKFRTPKVKRSGKYYVTVEADSNGQCTGAQSPTRRIRRR